MTRSSVRGSTAMPEMVFSGSIGGRVGIAAVLVFKTQSGLELVVDVDERMVMEVDEDVTQPRKSLFSPPPATTSPALDTPGIEQPSQLKFISRDEIRSPCMRYPVPN